MSLGYVSVTSAGGKEEGMRGWERHKLQVVS